MNDVQDVCDIVDKNIKFLSAAGYVLASKETTYSDILGTGVKWVYSANKIKRVITLRYQPPNKNGQECFSVFIGAPGFQSYILEELFRKQDKANLNEIFYNFDKNIGGVDFCLKFLNDFKLIFEGEIFSIVSGVERVDVQIDLAPYR